MDYHRGLNLEVNRSMKQYTVNITVYATKSHIVYDVTILQVRIARIFNTYGPRMCIDDGRVVSNFVAQVSSNTIFP